VSSGNYPDLDDQSYSYVKALREKGGYDVYLQHYPELATYTDDKATHQTCAPGQFVRKHRLLHARGRPDDARAREERLAERSARLDLLRTAPAFEGFRFDGNCVYGPPICR